MQPNEKLPLAVFLNRALPKIVAEHLGRYTPEATHDMTLAESQARCEKHIDGMVDKAQEILKLIVGVSVPEAICTLVLAAYEVTLYGIEHNMLDEPTLNAMRQIIDLRRKQ